MSFEFRPAVRESVGLLIGLAGASGSGKTFSAMRLAQGIAGDRKFAVIDTEARRALHYADRFKFDHCDMRPPFSPDRYAEAILAADKAGYPVIVVDSASHEYAGDGGVLDMQEQEFQRMGSRESAKMASWIKPKTSHKRFVTHLLQVRAHLILCMRAEEKVEMRRRDGKTEIVPKETLSGFKGWIPICEKSLPFELTASFLMLPDRPGFPVPIKLQEQHKALFPADKPIDESAGERIAAWAHGGATSAKPPTDHGLEVRDGGPRPGWITPDQLATIETLIGDMQLDLKRQNGFIHKICGEYGVDHLEQLPQSKYTEIVNRIEAAKEAVESARVGQP